MSSTIALNAGCAEEGNGMRGWGGGRSVFTSATTVKMEELGHAWAAAPERLPPEGGDGIHSGDFVSRD